MRRDDQAILNIFYIFDFINNKLISKLYEIICKKMVYEMQKLLALKVKTKQDDSITEKIDKDKTNCIKSIKYYLSLSF